MQFQLQWHLCHARQPLDFRNKKFNTAVGLIDNVPTRKHEQKKTEFRFYGKQLFFGRERVIYGLRRNVFPFFYFRIVTNHFPVPIYSAYVTS